MGYTCPKCGKVIPSLSTTGDGKKQINSKYFPFCSQKCRLIDLGAWLDGDYSIAASPDSVDDEQTIESSNLI